MKEYKKDIDSCKNCPLMSTFMFGLAHFCEYYGWTKEIRNYPNIPKWCPLPDKKGNGE